MRILLLLAAAAAAAAEETRNDFSGAAGMTPFVFRRDMETTEAKTAGGRLPMLFGSAGQKCSVAFERSAEGAHRRIEARFSMALSGPNEGYCLALLPTSRFDEKGPLWDPQPARKTVEDAMREPDWAEPNLPDTLAVGFDVRNPKDEDWFNENGNYDGRPEREVSLHWDGREVANAFCPAGISTEAPVPVAVTVEFVCGGALVSVAVEGAPVYDRHFVPHAMPYECRVAFAAHGSGEAALDDVSVRFERPAAATPAPVRVDAFRAAGLRPGRTAEEAEIDFPALDAERVVMTVVYRGPMQRDYWDRVSAVHARDDEGRLVEIARITTPFLVWNGEYRYDVDVSAFAPLLEGRRPIRVMAGANVARGFLVDVAFTFFRRPADVDASKRAFRIVPLWSGSARFNEPGQIGRFLAERTIAVPEGATTAEARLCVSGHGVMEFTKLGRTLAVNGREWRSDLWTTDGYLNPYRRQFGTWKFDRAGWSPGAVVRPWVVDLTEFLPSGSLAIRYAPDPFEAKEWAEQIVEAVVVFYR
jgi:hypothetical protein